MRKLSRRRWGAVTIGLAGCLCLGLAWLHDRPTSPMPAAVHAFSCILADGRVLTMTTETKSVSESWQLNSSYRNLKLAGRNFTLEPENVVSGDRATNDLADLRIAGRDITIQPDKLTVQGRSTVSIPAGSERLDFAERGDVLTISADGVSLGRF